MASSFTGTLSSGGDMGPVKIGRDLRGGNIRAPRAASTAPATSGRPHRQIFIGGSVIAGRTTAPAACSRTTPPSAPMTTSAPSRSRQLVGNSGDGMINNLTQAIISRAARNARARCKDGHRHQEHQHRRARRIDADPRRLRSRRRRHRRQNGNASIGAVNVGGDWYASSISAGVNEAASALAAAAA